MWFMSGVLRLLWSYDSSLPYAVHDCGADGPVKIDGRNVWETPSSVTAACLPCHFNTHGAMLAMRSAKTGTLPRVPAARILKRCPCTPEAACELRREACLQNVTSKEPALESESDRMHIGRICNLVKGGQRAQETSSPPPRNTSFPCASPWFYGGAGAALSQALVSLLAQDTAYEVSVVYIMVS